MSWKLLYCGALAGTFYILMQSCQDRSPEKCTAAGQTCVKVNRLEDGKELQRLQSEWDALVKPGNP